VKPRGARDYSADHGNRKAMIDPKTAPHIPIHTTNPVRSSRHGNDKFKVAVRSDFATLRPLCSRHRRKSPADMTGTIANLAVMRFSSGK